MTARGSIRPFQLPTISALLLPRWIATETGWNTGENVSENADLPYLQTLAIPMLCCLAKIKKAGLRARRHNRIKAKVATAHREEAQALLEYISYRFGGPPSGKNPAPVHIHNHASDLMQGLALVLQPPGRPRLSHEGARKFLADYAATKSSLRVDRASWTAVVAARKRVADLERAATIALCERPLLDALGNEMSREATIAALTPVVDLPRRK